ncbi:MAG TPA: VWA domain-containing protein [Bryocella sp.]|nr:VWA domain-containing protein [Bryocella sp.]
MRRVPKCALQKILAMAVVNALLCPNLALAQQSEYTFKAQSELVLVNVSVRDRNGNLMRDLKPGDFTILEDGKPQKVATFDIENMQKAPAVETAKEQVDLLGVAPKKATAIPEDALMSKQAQAIKDRRLIILFFDLSAMEPDEIERSAQAAQNYVDKQMQPADLVAVVSLASSITLNQDFTSDRALLKKALQGFNLGAGAGFEEGSVGTTEGTPDNANSFTVDDTEYNIFNTDRRLEALRTVAQQVASVPQQKALIYFSSGMDRTGIENESELRSAINAAVLANMAIYTMDIRGLQALPPGGAAQNASLRGISPYNGASTLNDLNSNFTTQETLVSLSVDTGGRAYLDSNDFTRVFRGVQQDMEMYYLLGYHSTNTAHDGKFRRITVRVNRPGVKLEYRKGYYATADFKHSNKEDRERQLQEELASDLPSTELPLYLATGYFRLADNRFYVPISLIVPGSAIPFTRNRDQDKATLDVIGVVTDEKKLPAGAIRDTVKLAVNAANEVQRKNVQYDNGVVLPPGKYHLKIVVRENENGQMGAFETDFTIPDLKSTPVKMSSIVMSSQLEPAGKRDTNDPLVRNGSKIVPSVTRVFSSGQHLYLYYEVYDPARSRNGAGTSANGQKAAAENRAAGETKDSVRLLSNVSFFKGDVKAYETSLTEVREISVPNRHAAAFQLEVPLSALKPGFYTCQVNVIDDAAGHFVFPRLALLIRP